MQLPSLVEIEINSGCNLSCSYCPNSNSSRVEKGEMELELFEKIISQLAHYNYRGQIAFEFYNEPLLAKKFNTFVTLLKKQLPLTTLVIYSNGLKLDNFEVLENLYNLGVDKFIITKHEDVANLSIENDLNKIKKIYGDRFIFQTHNEIKKYNRAGTVELGNKVNVQDKPCGLPRSVLTISVKGNVLSCFEDFFQKYTFGNAYDKNVIEIWNSQNYEYFRVDLKNGNRSKYETCSKCDRVDGINNMPKNKHLIDDQELMAVKRVLESGKLFRYGGHESESDLCEKEFAAYFNIRHAHIVSSGTNALINALMTLGISYGDEVIIPAYTFFATAGSVLSVGAIPVVVDIEDDLCMSVETIKSRISDRTKAIIVVHMDGIQCKIDEIVKYTKELNIPVIEDVAQAMGASYKSKKLGTWGDFGCFSFNRDKTITAGEGGLVITNDPKLEKRLISTLDQAISFNPTYAENFQDMAPILGISTRISEITSAILRVQLTKIDSIINENRLRKNIILDEIEHSQVLKKVCRIIKSNDPEECGSVVHLNFQDPVAATTASKKLLSGGIVQSLITLRRAHCVWKWSHFLKEGMSFSDKRDPYKNTDKKYDYHKTNFMTAFNVLSSTIRLEIDLSRDLEQTKSMAKLLVTLLEDIHEKL